MSWDLGGAEATHQVRLAGQVPQVIVESAGTRIGAVLDCFHGADLVEAGGKPPDFGELLLQPRRVAQRSVQRVEVGGSLHSLGLIALHGELHVDALVQGFT